MGHCAGKRSRSRRSLAELVAGGALVATVASTAAGVLLAPLTLGLAACRPHAAETPPPPKSPAAELDFQQPSPDWVTVYDPRLASNGYTLTLLDARVPALLDMNGRPVHLWPQARIKSRVRLLPDGSILGIGLGRQVVEYDWEGRQTWAFRTPGAIPHHDVLRCANGHTLVLVLVDGEGSDTIYEVAHGGRVVWTWRAAQQGRALIPRRPEHPDDVTHINSIQELPPNPWFTAGDSRFRPGNLLLSARNLNTLFIVERPSGKVVWTYTADLDRQHEAAMNGPDQPAPGMIAVFNNRLGSFWGNHQSELLEIDPRRRAVVWRYSAPGFFSPTGGCQQILPNGDVLITSTRGGRVFEVTHAGQPVWEWVPPYEPVRAVRVGARACPQLARLATPPLHTVVEPASLRHVDPDAYRFARQGSRKNVEIDGVTRTVLKEESDCRHLVLPGAARILVGYGVDRQRLLAAGRGSRPPRFVVTLAAGGGRAVEILRDTVGLSGAGWRERTIPLGAYSLQAVELCVDVEEGAPDAAPAAARFAYWEQPDVAGREPGPRSEDDGDGKSARGLSAEEREVRRQHLRALGYVN
jgi:hypothetical protein